MDRILDVVAAGGSVYILTRESHLEVAPGFSVPTEIPRLVTELRRTIAEYGAKRLRAR